MVALASAVREQVMREGNAYFGGGLTSGFKAQMIRANCSLRPSDITLRIELVMRFGVQQS